MLLLFSKLSDFYGAKKKFLRIKTDLFGRKILVFGSWHLEEK